MKQLLRKCIFIFLHFTKLRPEISLLLVRCSSGIQMDWNCCRTCFLPQNGLCISYIKLWQFHHHVALFIFSVKMFEMCAVILGHSVFSASYELKFEIFFFFDELHASNGLCCESFPWTIELRIFTSTLRLQVHFSNHRPHARTSLAELRTTRTEG